MDHTLSLGFERAGSLPILSRWSGQPSGPAGTLFLDSAVVHSGRYSGRLERTKDSPATFSSLAFELPCDFRGDTLELRGWLKYENVVGSVGLWQRQDGAGQGAPFNNMRERMLQGTADWTEYSLKLPLHSKTRSVSVGSLLSGTGRLWADDLRLYVDGKPLAEAPSKLLTVVDTDTSFKASSGITIDKVTPVQHENLVLLGKVWGFLKYHHPAVVTGKRHWDFDLFRVMPRMLAAKDAATGRRALATWIDSLGKVPPCSSCAKLPENRELSPRLEWLANQKWLGKDVSAQLVHIHKHRRNDGEQYFVSMMAVGNPDFSTELAYPRQAEPDAGYRILALYRLWNIIEYWSPYRELTEPDWDGVLREFIPRLLAARTPDLYKLELMSLIARVRDTHSNLWSAMHVQPPGGRASVPVSVRFIEDQAVVTGHLNPRLGPASGLQVGDLITHVDGLPVDTLVARWRPLFAASNESARLRDMGRALTRGESASVELSILRDGKPLVLRPERVPNDSLDAMRAYTHDHPGPTFRRISADIAYLKLSTVKTAEVDQYLRGAEGARCLVIDLRNYPSDFMVFALGQHLVKDSTAFVKFTSGDLRNPGAFTFGKEVSLKPKVPYIEGAVAVLIDEVTQSQAEYTTMAFRSRPGCLVVGSQTAGADGNVSRIPLPGNQRTMISGIGIYYPDGKPTQGIGIVPDLEVKPTLAGIRAGRDEVLDAAVRKLLGRDLTESERQSLAGPGDLPKP